MYEGGRREGRRKKKLRRKELRTESRIMLTGGRDGEEKGIGRSRSHDLVYN